MNLHKTILATEEKMNATGSGLNRFFLGFYLLFLYIILGFTHVVIVLFLPATHSFKHVNFLDERTGYTTSYSSHLRLKHNLRFGTLAYSLVLITSIVFVSTAIQIINPEKFGQSALAANLVVSSGADTNNGACIPGACTLRDALTAANPGDTVTFAAAYTITLTSELPQLDKVGLVLDGTVGVDRVTIDCNNVAATGLKINADNVTVKDLIVKKCQFGTNVLTGADNPTFSKTTYTNNTQDGLNFSSGVGGSVLNTYIANNGGSGTFLQGRTGASITSSTIESNTSYGIILDSGSTGTTIDGNNIYSNGQAGIRIQVGSNNPTISNNFIGVGVVAGVLTNLANSADGIYASDTSGITITGNVIGDNAGNGIALSTVTNSTVTNNQIGIYNGTQVANGSGALVIGPAASGNTIGVNFSGVGTANSLYAPASTPTIMVSGAGTTDNSTRNNSYNDAIRTMTVAVANNAGSAITPTGSWFGTTVNGTADANAAIDVYDSSIGSLITSTSADASGIWTITDSSIGTPTSLAVMATTSAGSSPFTIISSQTEPLTISNVSVSSITDTSATVTWDTNVNSDTEVVVQPTDGSASPLTPVLQDSVKKHSIELTGLTASTEYSFTATSIDSTDATNRDSSTGSLTTIAATPPVVDTTAPTISGVAAGTITTTGATITWVTDEAADSEVKYGTTTNYGSSTTDNSFVTNHSITLNGLTAATTYHYVVKSTDGFDNIGYSADNTFTTSSISSYLDSVVSNIQITDSDGHVTNTTAATTSISLPLSTLLFDFTDTNKSLDAYRVQFVIAIAKKNATAIVDKTKHFDVNGQAEFKVDQSKFKLNATYKVSTALLNQGEAVNPSGLAKRFNFTVVDGAPQIVSPKTINYLMPESFVVASTTDHVTVYLKDTTGKEVFHCVATMIDNFGECKPPFGAAKGLYTLEAVDPNGTSSSQPLYISGIADGGVLNTIAGRPEFNNRIIFTDHPTLTGLIPAGDTLAIRVPQIAGDIVPDFAPTSGPTASWKLTLSLYSSPLGETTAMLIHRRNGVIIDQTPYLFLRTPNAVKPAVIDPANNLKFANTAPVITVIGPKDHTLHIFNTAGVLLYTTGYSSGSTIINLGQWYPLSGSYTVRLSNTNPLGIASAATIFNFTIYHPAPVAVTTPTTTVTPTLNPTTPTTTVVTPTLNPTTTPTTSANTTPPSSVNGTDTDGDGLSDAYEIYYGLNPNLADSDYDGLSDGAEVAYHTDPLSPDTDGDGVNDGDEIILLTDPLVADQPASIVPTSPNADQLTDTDGDGITDVNDTDDDNDGLSDELEVVLGTNPLNPDSDGNGVTDGAQYQDHQIVLVNPVVPDTTTPTSVSAPVDGDADGDGIQDSIDTDADGDGITDVVEVAQGSDPLVVTDPTDTDWDSDGISNPIEVTSGTDQSNPDTDGDSLDDGDEALHGTDPLNNDTDSDGVSDGQEITTSTDPLKADAPTTTTTKIVDTDHDGLSDTEETTKYNTDPNNPDTDSDGMYDGDEVIFGSDPLTTDGDNDGLTDPQENTLGTNPNNADSDADGINDGAEVADGTDPANPDSDNDGLLDGEEPQYNTDPNIPDTDHDGLLDREEIDRGCDPLQKDTDGDGVIDGDEATAGTQCAATDSDGDGIPDAIDPTVNPQAIQSISSLEKTFQDIVNSTYAISGIESLNYPMITSPAVALSTAQRSLVKTILTKDISGYTNFTIVPGNNADVQTAATTIVTITKEFNITDWLSNKTNTNPATTYIVLSGQVDLPQSTQLPYALQSQPRYVVVSLFSTPVVKIAEVDTNGRWTMTIPAELLSTGDHAAYAAAEVNGTRSDQVQVAKFVIQQKNTLSNTTWLVIVNIAIAFTAIVISITLQLKRKRRMI